MSNSLDAVRRSDNPALARTSPGSLTGTDRLARQLGWFSIGLGVVELVAARSISRALSMPNSEGLIRAFGAREIASGVMTLSVDTKAGLYSRVAGDALDLAVIGAAVRDDNPRRGNAVLALAMVAGVTLLDVAAALATRQQNRRDDGDVRDYSDRSGFPQGVGTARGQAEREARTAALPRPPAPQRQF